MIEKQLRLFDDEVQNAVFLTFCFMAILLVLAKTLLRCAQH